LPAKSSNDIKTFIKNGLTDKPIVPGSSVKGAIRSILLKEFLSGSKPSRLDERQIFGSSTDGDEFMRFIKISDADFEKTKLMNTKIFNLYKDGSSFKGGWKHSGGKFGKTNAKYEPTGFNTIYEVLMPGEKGMLSIALSDRGMDNLIREYIKKNLTLSYQDIEKKNEILTSYITEKLFSIINNHTKEYIDKQIKFFEKYSNNETDNIIENLRNIKTQILDDNSSCVLKMSAGSGFHSITGDWQFDDFSINQIDFKKRNRGKLNGEASAKSRKIAIDGNDFYLMGFVRLTVIRDEEITKREKEQKAIIEKQEQLEAEKIAREKAEQERLEKEQKAKEEAARKAEEERIAKEKAEREKRKQLLKQREEEEKQRQEANKQKREKLAQEGLRVLNDIDNFNKGKNIIKEYKKINKAISREQYNYIKEFIKRCIPKGKPADWKSLKRGNWKDIKSWVGQETAQEWFNEMMKQQ